MLCISACNNETCFVLYMLVITKLNNSIISEKTNLSYLVYFKYIFKILIALYPMLQPACNGYERFTQFNSLIKKREREKEREAWKPASICSNPHRN